MEKDYTTFIAGMISNQGKLVPAQTGLEPQLQLKTTVRAVFFDIYGTLLISSSGDVDEAGFSPRNLKQAFRDGGYQIKTDLEAPWQSMISKFIEIVKETLKSSVTPERPFPEIDIRSAWQSLVDQAEKSGYVKTLPGSDPDKAIICFEILSNPVFPMPGMAEILHHFKSLGLPMGIVSNAQFYTIHLMNYFLNNPTDDNNIGGFDPDMCIFSFKEGKGKPDSFLYKKLAGRLMSKFGIPASEAIFIGNDMLKDVAAAKKEGFITALFAGDKKSLRLRRDSVPDLIPDIIITDLLQLKSIV
jgi:putative hydrolase of the HAD superfamily